jgi:uncharacterized protein with GYD domain
MPTYISLLNWTDAGIKGAKGTLDRAQAAGELAASLGGSLKDVYYTIGPYDIVGIAEFPDDESATAWLLATGGQGNVRSTTMRAFSRDEFGAVLGKLD